MNAREQRGIVIAALCKLKRNGDEWIVPSQSGEKLYRVNAKAQTCTCPDFIELSANDGTHKCKHLFAVEFTIKREVGPDGTVTDTRTVTFTERKTYKQDWTAYNAAQSVEKDRVQELLADLVRGVPEPSRTGPGRKPHGVRNSLFAMVYKVYSTFSSRRFSCDLREAWRRGHITHSIPGRKVCEFFENPDYTPYLKELVGQSARPLRALESQFAIDSSGFATHRYERWYDQKYGVTRTQCTWVKCHIASGTKTNCVCAIRILDKDAADSPQFAPLVEETARNFSISEVSADKAYASLANFEAVAGVGGTGYLAFKENATGGVGGLFEKMFHYFQFRKDEFMQHYHRRSNVESTFSAIKRKFGSDVKSRTETACVNEVICKCIAHNLTCLVQEQHELGIEAVFWKNDLTDERAILPFRAGG